MNKKTNTGKIRPRTEEELIEEARKPLYMLLAIFISIVVCILWAAMLHRWISWWAAWPLASILTALTLTWHGWAINKLRR